jgi:hypothetical protein
VISRGTPCAPPVNTSQMLGPLPPLFQPPSTWCAATAPPHKKSFGKVNFFIAAILNKWLIGIESSKAKLNVTI